MNKMNKCLDLVPLFYPFTLACVVFMLGGCSSASVLPSEEKINESPWKNFEQAKNAYNLVISNYTTNDELKELGFDPYKTPNVKILTYLDIVQRFIPSPSIHIEDLDPGIQRCLKARENCYAYEAKPGQKNSQRNGNAFLDILNFRKKTQYTGWEFDALIVLVNDLVVYKIDGGTPILRESGDQKNPLGPFQGARDFLLK